MGVGKRIAVLGLLLAVALPASARVGLVTVPRRDAVQLTIYNSADITLVREERVLTLAKGRNKLEFSWAGTLIDPTSVQFEAKTHADKVEVVDISFPAQAPNALVWSIESEVAGEVKVEISYFTSGLTWSADYDALVDKTGKRMTLSSYVKVTNKSGEEYENAQVRLVVGTLHLVERIADLAQRRDKPLPAPVQREARSRMTVGDEGAMHLAGAASGANVPRPPEIIREGLSEYFLYTVSGTHQVPDGWSVRWLNFAQPEVPVENFYRFEEGRYNQPRRFLRLSNSEACKLGREPLPDGMIRGFQSRDDGSRVFLGQSRSKYVPVKEKWEIDLGADPQVIVKPKQMAWSTDNVEFNNHGSPSGWDVIEKWVIEVINSRADAITIEIDRNFSGDFTLAGVTRDEMYDIDTARFRRTLAARERTEIAYELTTRKGTRVKR